MARAVGSAIGSFVTSGSGTIEAFQRVRLARGVVAANRDLALLRAMFRWGVLQDHIERTPFKKGGEAAIKLTPEHARRRRLRPGEAERLLAACNPHLRSLVEAALETGCRRGELLSLQWHQVRFAPFPEVLLPAQKTKTHTDRTIPISPRLQAILEMRRLARDGTELPPYAYVFGTEIGGRVKGFKRAWQRAVLRAHGHVPQYVVKVVREGPRERKVRTSRLTPQSQPAYRSIGLHFHDLRREAGSRWLDHGVPLHAVQQLLGHANISQTSNLPAGPHGRHPCGDAAGLDGASPERR
jgi:integrase